MTEEEERFLPTFYRRLEELIEERGSAFGVDLGCGTGKQAVAMTNIGCTVTAVDRNLPPEETCDPRITWLEWPLSLWLKNIGDDEFDFVLLRNVLHFLPKEFVYNAFLPKIAKRIRSGGFVGITAFYQEPKPALRVSLTSLHPLDRLKKPFEDWDPVQVMDLPYTGPSLYQPIERIWWNSRLIIRKPTND